VIESPASYLRLAKWGSGSVCTAAIEAANVRFEPEADILRRNGDALFDHLVGAREQRRWYHQAKRLSRFKIDR
jgi:hypothetical protein